MTSKSAVKRRPLWPKKRPNAGSATLLWKASGLKWLVRLYPLTDSLTAYLGFPLMSLETRESTEKPLGNSCPLVFSFFSSRRRHTRYIGDWSSDVCSSDLPQGQPARDHHFEHAATGHEL